MMKILEVIDWNPDILMRLQEINININFQELRVLNKLDIDPRLHSNRWILRSYLKLKLNLINHL